MIAFSKSVCEKEPAPAWSEGFMAMLPAIRREAYRFFRQFNEEACEEAVAEAIASSMVAYARLYELGKVDLAYPTVLARYAAAQVRQGRRVGTGFRTRDVFSQKAQRRHGFAIERLDRFDKDTGQWIEATVEDTTTPVSDQAAFRIDFPEWLATHTPRNHRIAEMLAIGYSTRDTAKHFRISPSRVSQLRREFDDSWREFHEDGSANQTVAAVNV